MCFAELYAWQRLEDERKENHKEEDERGTLSGRELTGTG